MLGMTSGQSIINPSIVHLDALAPGDPPRGPRRPAEQSEDNREAAGMPSRARARRPAAWHRLGGSLRVRKEMPGSLRHCSSREGRLTVAQHEVLGTGHTSHVLMKP